VPKYDAFGREIGEDTLAGLGASEYKPAHEAPADGWTDAQVAEAAAAEPEPEPEPFVAEPEPAGDESASHSDVRSSHAAAAPVFVAPTVRVRRRGGAGCLVALIVLAVIAAAPIVAIVSLVGGASDAIDEVTDAFDSLPEDVVVPEIPETPEAPTGIGGESLVARANFAGALERLGGMGGATLIRLAPERLDAQLVRRARPRSVQVDFQGAVTRGPATGGGAGLTTIALSAIDPGAPARLVRGSAARYKVRTRGINYLVMTPWPGEGHRWIAYFKNGVYVQGDRRGRVVRRIS
jgi:hypothetical protein